MTVQAAPASKKLLVFGSREAVFIFLGIFFGAGVPLVFLALFFAWPTATLISMGFIDNGSLDLTTFGEVMTAKRTWSVIWQTLWMAACGTIGSVIFGIPGAYVLYRTVFPGRTFARAVVAIPFVLPTVAVSVGFRALLSQDGPLGFLGLEGSMTGIVAAMIFFNMSLVIRSVGSVWAQLDPRMEQAAATLGASPPRVFATVTLPSLGPAIASAASVVFLYCSTAYSIVLVLGRIGTATLETEIYMETSHYGNLNVASVLSIVQLVVVVSALLMADRARKRVQSTLKMTTHHPARRFTIRDIPAAFVLIASMTCLVVIPMAAVVVRSLQRKGQWTIANYIDLFSADVSPTLQVSVVESLWISMKTALLSGLIAATVGLCVALMVSRRPRRRSARIGLSFLDAAFMLPLGVSAVTVGFGFLVTLSQPPLDLSSCALLIPCAQAVVAIPLVVRIILPVLRAIDPRQREVAATLGANPARVLATVEGPVMMRSGLVAFGFAVAISMGEFGATSFLARPSTPTLPVVIYQLISRPTAVEQGLAMSGSLVLCVATALMMIGLERLNGSQKEGVFHG
ncbi:MAG: iron ABC transporter permease [Actinomycetaceae bacterium]|nr:iron ABC transporter permease [Actinomycetaceae bacterium]